MSGSTRRITLAGGMILDSLSEPHHLWEDQVPRQANEPEASNKSVDHISHSSRCEKNGHRNVMNEMKEHHMREHDIISAGVKLVGLFLLLLGAVALFRESISFILQLLHLDTRDLPADTWQIVAMIGFAKLNVAIAQVALGVYLCKGGKWFVSKLCHDTTDS